MPRLRHGCALRRRSAVLQMTRNGTAARAPCDSGQPASSHCHHASALQDARHVIQASKPPAMAIVINTLRELQWFKLNPLGRMSLAKYACNGINTGLEI